MLFFAEADQDWRAVPQWASFLIQLGLNWPEDAARRRIALISMPCDSAAAGLISLGALIRDLGNPNADDIGGHHDSLLRYARQYLENCWICSTQCQPEVSRCGYAAQATGKIRSVNQANKVLWISDRTNFEERQVAFVSRSRNGINSDVIIRPSPGNITRYYIDGTPPPELIKTEGILPENVYPQIVGGNHIIAENLHRSFSGLCLAGRVAGENATWEMCTSIRLRVDGSEYSLSELLTIHGWSSAKTVSRMLFLNARTGRLDRRAHSPALIISDGAECFLKVLGQSDFQRSDVIGVIHRTMERDKLEDIGNKMLALRQWYVEDSEMLGSLMNVPHGISVMILKSAKGNA